MSIFSKLAKLFTKENAEKALKAAPKVIKAAKKVKRIVRGKKKPDPAPSATASDPTL